MKIIVGRNKDFEIKKIYSKLTEYTKKNVKPKSAQVMLSNAIRTGIEFDGLFWNYEEIDNNNFCDYLNSSVCTIGNRNINCKKTINYNLKILLTYKNLSKIIMNNLSDKNEEYDFLKCGIYCVYKDDIPVYVGTANSPFSRMYVHLQAKTIEWEIDMNNNPNSYSWEVLENCDYKDKFEREKYWIMKFNPKYNLRYTK